MDKDNVKDEENNNKPSKITVVSGDGSDLNISKVYDHLNVDEPSSNVPGKKQGVVIPKEKK